MKKSTLFLIVLMTLFFGACNEKEEFQIQKANDQELIDFRSGDNCADFSDCSDLVERRPMNFSFGPGAVPDNWVEFGGPAGLCSDPNVPPLAFRLTVDVRPTGNGRAYTIPHMGRIKSVTGSLCLRPYVQDNEAFPDPIPQQFPPEIYPICGEFSADYVLTSMQGDELWFTLEFNSSPKPGDIFTYVADGRWIINGGTGRFEDATGGGCMTGYGLSNFLAPNFGQDDIWILSGGIDY